MPWTSPPDRTRVEDLEDVDLDHPEVGDAESSLVLNPNPSPDGHDRFVRGRASPIVFADDPPSGPFIGQVYIDATRQGIDPFGRRP